MSRWQEWSMYGYGMSRGLGWLGVVLVVLLGACGRTAGTPTAQPTAAVTPPAITPAPIPAGIGPTNKVSPCTAVAAGDGPGDSTGDTAAAPAPAAVPTGNGPAAGAAGLEVRYDGDANTIIVIEGSQVTLTALRDALNRPAALQEYATGEWLLGANLRIEAGATVQVAAPEVRWLKLRSEGKDFVSIWVLGGQLAITDSCVSSWDTASNSFDSYYRDGRSFVVAREGATMTIRGSDLRYLGYNADESFGLSWRLAGTRGEIVDSYLAYNYYGLYTYAVNDLVIRRNEVHNNVLYGLDPHTGSHRLVIEDNLVHSNGKHGIILAEDCTEGIIRNNVVHSNLHHGIVLYQRSNNNLVEDNVAYNNAAQGININDAAGNTVRNNTVYNNREDGIGVGQQSSENTLVNNQVYANQQDGIVLYSEATRTALLENTIESNGRYGVYIKSDGAVRMERNEIAGNTVGVYLLVAPQGEIAWDSNTIRRNLMGDVQRAEQGSES